MRALDFTRLDVHHRNEVLYDPGSRIQNAGRVSPAAQDEEFAVGHQLASVMSAKRVGPNDPRVGIEADQALTFVDRDDVSVLEEEGAAPVVSAPGPNVRTKGAVCSRAAPETRYRGRQLFCSMPVTR